MKATLSTQNQNARHTKGETISKITLIAYYPDDERSPFHEVVTAYFLMGRSSSASVVTCSLWVHGKQNGQYFETSGQGKAGGYGYHKDSAALADAIDSAGIKLDRSISGVGSEAMREALLAIGTALGYDKMHIVS